MQDHVTVRAQMTPEAVVQRYFLCLDTEDWETMRGLWHADAQLRAVGTRPRNGVDEVIDYFSRLFAPWPAHRDAPTRVIAADGVVVAEVTFTGTTHSGLEVRFDAVDVFDVDAGRIRRLSNWYDLTYAREILGSGSKG